MYLLVSFLIGVVVGHLYYAQFLAFVKSTFTKISNFFKKKPVPVPVPSPTPTVTP